MAAISLLGKNAQFRKRITDRMSTEQRSEFETALGVPLTGSPKTTQAKAGPLRATAASGDTTEPQKKKRRDTLGAPTNLGKKRLLGG